MGLRCWVFGHEFKRPVDGQRGPANFKVCSRCRRVMKRGYYDGWKQASGSESGYYLRMFDAIRDRGEQMAIHGDPALVTATAIALPAPTALPRL